MKNDFLQKLINTFRRVRGHPDFPYYGAIVGTISLIVILAKNMDFDAPLTQKDPETGITWTLSDNSVTANTGHSMIEINYLRKDITKADALGRWERLPFGDDNKDLAKKFRIKGCDMAAEYLRLKPHYDRTHGTAWAAAHGFGRFYCSEYRPR